MGTLRDSILAAEDLPREQVQTDEWAPFGVPFVYIRALSSSERDAYELSLQITTADGRRVPNPRLKNVRAAFVAKVLVDEDGERVFTDKDTAALAEKNAAVLDRLFDVGRRLSGMQSDDELEEEGNPTSGDPDDSSSLESPSLSESPTLTDSESD